MASYSDAFITRVGVEYEAGKLTQREMASKYKISRATLQRWVREHGWVQGKLGPELAQKIEKRATEKIVEQSSDILFDTEKNHIINLDYIEHLTKFNLTKYHAIIKESKEKDPRGVGEITKAQSEQLHAAQKFLNEAIKTLNTSFIDKRKALGLDKEKDTPNNVMIDKIEFNGIDPDGPAPD